MATTGYFDVATASWQAEESQRSIARDLRVARETVRRYIPQTESLGLSQTGPPPTEDQVIELSRLAHEGLAHGRAQPSTVQLGPYKDQLAGWVEEGMQFSRMLELLSSDVVVSYNSLRRFLARTGLVSRAKRTSSVRMAPSAPGEIAEIDFGRLGTLVHAETGARQVVWTLTVVLPFSRFASVWLLVHQTLEEVIAGLDARVMTPS